MKDQNIPAKAKVAKKWCATLLAATFACGTALAQAQYDQGASDKEIVIGQTMPYSGPASVYGTVGKLQLAYFKKINDEGGINGRQVRLISLDDGYMPAKTIEVVRRLVESEQVLFLYSNLGSPTNSAIQRYVHMKKVPHVFHTSGNQKWDDPKNFPWSMAFTPSYFTEGQIYAQHALQTVSDPKIAVLYQNDDYGRDYLEGFKAGLGDKAANVVAEASYEVTDPTITSQINTLAASGANVFLNASSPKFAALAIRRAAEVGWMPTQYLPFPASSVGGVLKPAGLEASKGVISVGWLKDPVSQQWANDAGVQDYRAFMSKYYPEGDLADNQNTYAYANVLALVKVLEMAGDTLTRENVMRQAASLDEVELPILLPGIRLKTSADDYAPVQTLQPLQFDGQEWQPVGQVMSQSN